MSKHERDLIVEGIKARRRGLGSSGVEAGAALWRWEVVEASVCVQSSVSRVAQLVEESVSKIGMWQPDSAGLTTVVGTGWFNLNCAVVSVPPGVACADDEVALTVRSVSAEGLVKQHGAMKAFDRLVEDLRREAPVRINSVSTSLQGRTGVVLGEAGLRVGIGLMGLALFVAAIVIRGVAGGGLFLAGLVLSVVSTFLALRSRRGGR